LEKRKLSSAEIAKLPENEAKIAEFKRQADAQDAKDARLQTTPKTKVILEEFLRNGITSPTEMARLSEIRYGKKISRGAFAMVMNRLGLAKQELADLKIERLQ
jgi:hypothetical protein